MLISVGGLSKVYRTREGEDIRALTEASFAIDEGEFVTVVGPSGCGKSTLLKILAGILRRTSGEVLLRSRPVDGPSRDVGVVFQAPVLLPWRNVLQNVMLPIEIQRRDRVQLRAARARLHPAGRVSKASRASTRTSSRAACSSASASAARWCTSRRCCSWTSPSARSTR